MVNLNLITSPIIVYLNELNTAIERWDYQTRWKEISKHILFKRGDCFK